MRVSAFGMPTALSSSRARARATFVVTSRWSCTASTSCFPIEWTGLSEVIGSWKIIEISFPRMSRSSRRPAVSRSLPFQRASPLETVLRFGFRPMTVRQVTLFPQPDSPTMPSVWPFSIENETPSTARTIPSSVWKDVCRSLTSRSAKGLGEPDARVDPGVQDVDQQVEDDDREGGEDDHALDHGQVVVGDGEQGGVPEAGQVVDALGEDRTPERQPDVHPEDGDDGQQRVAEHVRAQ